MSDQDAPRGANATTAGGEVAEDKEHAAHAISTDNREREIISRGPVVITCLICGLAAAAGHAILWIAYGFGWGTPWQPVMGIALSIVILAAFGGFYVASRRARIAIAASFLLTFLVSLTYVLTIDELAEMATNEAQVLVDDFRSVVMIIIGFYFGSEAAVSVAKVWRAGSGATAQEIARADRDLVSPRRSERGP